MEPCPAILESLERGNAPHFLSGNDRTTAGSANIGIVGTENKAGKEQAGSGSRHCLPVQKNQLLSASEREREAGGAAYSFSPFPVTE